jgi:ABC-type Na+ transport system ATPase subunit NatA
MKLLSPSSAEAVVAMTDVSRRFGAKTVLNAVSLYVPRGSVFGLVGENGAGKTTLIKHILGLLRAESGTVRVFSLDPVADPVAVLGHVGYLSEQPNCTPRFRMLTWRRHIFSWGIRLVVLSSASLPACTRVRSAEWCWWIPRRRNSSTGIERTTTTARIYRLTIGI